MLLFRIGYDLSHLTSHRPRTTLEPITTHPSTQSELEYLEIFDFFNYPRLNTLASSTATTINNEFDGSASITSIGDSTPTQLQSLGQGQAQSLRATPAAVFVPSAESDWLLFKPP